MKRYRIMKIKEIIQNQVIETQEELTLALQREGIVVTQATVSRDIKELMLAKVPYGGGRYRYALSEGNNRMMSQNHVSVLFREAVTKIDSSLNLVVIHTIPGSAQSVAFTFDHSEDPAIVGTVAGDDTILIVIRTPEEVPDFVKKIQSQLKA